MRSCLVFLPNHLAVELENGCRHPWCAHLEAHRSSGNIAKHRLAYCFWTSCYSMYDFQNSLEDLRLILSAEEAPNRVSAGASHEHSVLVLPRALLPRHPCLHSSIISRVIQLELGKVSLPRSALRLPAHRLFSSVCCPSSKARFQKPTIFPKGPSPRRFAHSP
ncbi:hypothetical protein LZ32DRAFT_300692 [Colletotrichum eremochloae]|nr:hypothetical protein LZ32DRAFT_300692 [Colletotrichum eremochloae]